MKRQLWKRWIAVWGRVSPGFQAFSARSKRLFTRRHGRRWHESVRSHERSRTSCAFAKLRGGKTDEWGKSSRTPKSLQCFSMRNSGARERGIIMRETEASGCELYRFFNTRNPPTFHKDIALARETVWWRNSFCNHSQIKYLRKRLTCFDTIYFEIIGDYTLPVFTYEI